jgi:hypothetical protein
VDARLLAFLASAVVIISAAYVPDLSSAIRSAFPGHYRQVVGGAVLSAISAALIVVAVQIRTNRRRRFSLVAFAVGIAAAYFSAFRTGNVEVDVVEAFHFVEYGALAILFHHAWRHYGDARRFVLPIVVGVAVGVLDESLQWFLASRVGEAHDVMMDLVAATCGLLVAVALDPPLESRWRWDIAATRHVVVVCAAVLVLFAAFFNAVHVGYEISDPEIGVFRSRYRAEALQWMAEERGRRWTRGLPAGSRFSREDQYLTEALWHVRARNEAVRAGDALTAWRENRILEKFYAPLVERPAINGEYRWPSEQRALIADAAARAHATPFVSEAEALPIYVLRK